MVQCRCVRWSAILDLKAVGRKVQNHRPAHISHALTYFNIPSSAQSKYTVLNSSLLSVSSLEVLVYILCMYCCCHNTRVGFEMQLWSENVQVTGAHTTSVISATKSRKFICFCFQFTHNNFPRTLNPFNGEKI